MEISDPYFKEDNEHVPYGKQPVDNGDEPMDECYDRDIPNIANSKYFTFAPVRKHNHPTNPNTNGLISSRILPDGSNTIRFTTALTADIEVPETPSDTAQWRMNTESFHEDYSARGEDKPTILQHGVINLNWVE